MSRAVTFAPRAVPHLTLISFNSSVPNSPRHVDAIAIGIEGGSSVLMKETNAARAATTRHAPRPRTHARDFTHRRGLRCPHLDSRPGRAARVRYTRATTEATHRRKGSKK